MRRLGRDLERIAGFHFAGRLTFDRKLEAAFQHVRRFNSRMRMPADRHARFYRGFHEYCRIARHRTVCLRQDLSTDATPRCGRRALRRGGGRNKLANSTERARRKSRKAASRQHDQPPCCARIASVRTHTTRYATKFGATRATAAVSVSSSMHVRRFKRTALDELRLRRRERNLLSRLPGRTSLREGRCDETP